MFRNSNEYSVMIKRILEDIEFTFDASTKTITFVEDIEISKLLLITNITDNIIIYNFACDGFGGTYSSKILTLEYDTTTMSDTDTISIIINEDSSASEKERNSYLNELRINNKSLESIIELLIEQNELIKTMF